MSDAPPRVGADRVRDFIGTALRRVGVPDDDAATVAALMAEADLQGSDGHGVIRLPQYARRIRAGGLNLHPAIHVLRERPGMALIDGDNGMGHLVMTRAAELAIVAAYGKVKAKAQRGETMPEGWMIDRDGKPLTDPRRADEGFLLPIGGYKGYGLALIVGLLAGTLNGAAMGKDVIDFNHDDKSVTNTGQALVAIDIAAFGELNAFKDRVDTLIDDLHASRRMPNVDRIWLPGEQSNAKRIEYSRDGIPIAASLQQSLDRLADDLGIERLV